MATWLDQKIEQLEIMVEKYYAIGQVVGKGPAEAEFPRNLPPKHAKPLQRTESMTGGRQSRKQ